MSRKFRQLVKIEPKEPVTEEPVNYSSLGEYIPEEEFVHNLLSQKIENICNVRSEADRLDVQVDTIKNIAEVIRNDSGIATESINNIIINLYAMAGLTSSGERTFALEAYQSNLVATEGVGSFLRKIWEGIKKFVMGFIRAIRDFFKALLGIDVPVNKRKLVLKEQLLQIKKHGLVLDREKATPILTQLPGFLNIDNDDPSPSGLIDDANEMIHKYENYYNNTLKPLFGVISSDMIPGIKKLIEAMDLKVATRQDIINCTNVLLSLIGNLNSIRGSLLPHEVNMSDLPDNVLTRIRESINDEPLRYSVYSLFDPSKEKDMLCRKFNCFGIMHNQLQNFSELSDLSVNNIEMYYAGFVTAKNDIPGLRINPIDDSRAIEDTFTALTNMQTKINLKDIQSKVDTLCKEIDRCIDMTSKKIGPGIELIETQINNESFSYLTSLSELVCYAYFKNESAKLDLVVNELSATLNINIRPVLAAKRIKSAKDVEKLLNVNGDEETYQQTFEAIQSLTGYVMTEDVPLGVNEGGLDEEDREQLKDLPKMIDKVMRVGFTAIQNTLNMTATESSKTLREFEVSLLDYMTQSANQFN